MKQESVKTRVLSLATVVVLGLTACGGGGDSTTATSDSSDSSDITNTTTNSSTLTSTSVTGGAVDGYLQGATIFVDSNADGQQNSGEESVVTDNNGDFTLSGTISDGTKIYASGGIDKSTGYPFEGRLSTIYDSSQEIILSPLTTYVAALVDRNMPLADATALVAANLGIDPEDVHKDPMEVPEAFLASQKVQKTVEVIAAATNSNGDFNQAYENVFASLAASTENNGNDSDFNATLLVAQVEADSGVDLSDDLSTFLETYVSTVDDLADQNVSVDDLDAYGEVLNAYTEVAENALENNETLDSVQAAIEALDVTAVVENTQEDNSYTDPMVSALAEVNDALDHISYLGTNTADDNIVADLVLTDPNAAPFDSDDLNLTWSSNSPALTISGTTGVVVRDNIEDKAVELKATVNNALAVNSRTFNLVIKRVEHDPVAGDNNITIAEDTAVDIDFTAVISDLNNDALTITAVGDAAHGTVTLNNGVVHYVPALNYNGSDSFSYTVTDATGRSATGSVNVTVTAVDDATEWHTTANLGTQFEDFGAFTVTLDASDVDGNVSYSLVSYTVGVIATLSDATLTINSVENAYGTQEIVVAASEGGVDSNLTLTLEIIAVDDPTVWNNTPSTLIAVDEDFSSPVIVDLNATDVDSDITYSIVENNGIVDATLSDTTLTLTAKENANGTAEVVLAANGVEHTVSMVVNPVNDAPVVPSNDLTLSVKVNNTLSGQLNASDVDGDTLTFSNAAVTDGTISLESDGSFTYTAGSSDGNVTFTYDVSDGNTTVNAEQAITVVLSDPPVANPDSITLNEDAAIVSIDVLTNDTDDNDATLTIISATASNGVVTIEDNSILTYQPNANFNGTDTIHYVIEDSDGGQASSDVVVTVLAINDAPIIAPIDEITVEEDSGAYTVDLNVTDVDTNASDITLSVSSSDESIATVSLLGTTLQITPLANMSGDVYITIEANDGENNAVLSFPFIITAVNDVPEITDDTFTVAAGDSTSLDILSNDSDADGDTLAILGCNTDNINGSVNVDDFSIEYSIDADFEGTESFTCEVSDGMVTVEENVTVIVSNNHPPVVPNVTLTMLIGDTITGQIQASDEDNDSLTFSVVADGSPYITATLSSDGVYSVTAEQVGKGEIKLAVSDGTTTTYATYTIKVIYSQENADTFDVSEGAHLTSEEFDNLANTTHDSIPTDTKLYAAWGKNWNGSELVFETDYLEFMSDAEHTFIVSDDNETNFTHNNNLDGVVTVSMIDDEGNSHAVADAIMIDANMSAEDIRAEIPTLANLELPSGSVVYKMAVKMEMEEYDVWGPAEDTNNVVYNTLDDMFADGAMGIVAYNEQNHNHLLVFAEGDTLADGNGIVIEVDMTDVYDGNGEPIIINTEAGTWELVANGYEDESGNGNDMIKVTVNDIDGYEKYPILIEAGADVDGDGASTSVYRGNYVPAGDAGYEYRFNEVVYHALQNYYAPVTIADWQNITDDENIDVNETTFSDMTGLPVDDIVDLSPLYDFWIDTYHHEQAQFNVWSMQFNSDNTLDMTVTKDGVVDPSNSETLTYEINSDDNSITLYRDIEGETTPIFVMKILDSMSGSEITNETNLSVADDAVVYETAGLLLVDEVYYDTTEKATAYDSDGNVYTDFDSIDDFVTSVAGNLGIAFRYDGTNNYTLTLDNSESNTSGVLAEVNLDTGEISSTNIGRWEIMTVVDRTQRTEVLYIETYVDGYDDNMAFGMHGGDVLLRGDVDLAGEGFISYNLNRPMLEMLQANFTNQFLTPFTYEELTYLTVYGVGVDDRSQYVAIEYGSYFDHYRDVVLGTFETDNIENALRQYYTIVDGDLKIFAGDGTFLYTIHRSERNNMYSIVSIIYPDGTSFESAYFEDEDDARAFQEGEFDINP